MIKTARYVIIAAILISSCLNIGPAQASIATTETDKLFHEELLQSKSSSLESTAPNTSQTLTTGEASSKRQLLTDFFTSDKLNSHSIQSVQPASYSYSANIIQNGTFEKGHADWKEYYRSLNGSWILYYFIIRSSSAGYGNWHAYIMNGDWLVSNKHRVPTDTVDFRISYAYRLVHWGACSTSYGTNGVGVYLNDVDRGEYYVVNAHDAKYDPYNYDYVSTSFLASDVASVSQIGGHEVYLDFYHINDDSRCSLSLYLDNVSVEPVQYVQDYQITTSSGANGAVSSSYLAPQSSSYTVNVNPNSGFQIADVKIDTVSVGPVEYYTFSNIQASHSLSATFEPLSTSTKRVYRFWSDQNQAHFYTTYDDELTLIVNSYDPYVWKYETVAYKALPAQTGGSVPLHRFWSDQNQTHFYTAFEDEKNLIIATYPEHVWRYEGIAFYVYPSTTPTSSRPIYRFWSDQNQAHFYTAFEDEKNLIIATYPEHVWRYEGIAFKAPF